MNKKEIESQKDKIVNKFLNGLIDSQRIIFDQNTIKAFFLGEAYVFRIIKKNFHYSYNGDLKEERYDELLATFMKNKNVGQFLEPMIKELYQDFAKDEIKENKKKNNKSEE